MSPEFRARAEAKAQAMLAQETQPLRLFVGFWPDETVRQQLLAFRERWTWPEGVRFTPAEQLHLTVHFIGQYPRDATPAIDAALRELRHQRFALQLAEPDLWADGIAVVRARSAPALEDLHSRVGVVLRSHGVALDARPFAPHVTLAHRAVGAVMPKAAAAIDWPVSGMVLVESTPAPQHAYVVLRDYSPV